MSRQTQSPGLGKILGDLSLEKFATSLRADFRFAPVNTLLLVAENRLPDLEQICSLFFEE